MKSDPPDLVWSLTALCSDVCLRVCGMSRGRQRYWNVQTL